MKYIIVAAITAAISISSAGAISSVWRNGDVSCKPMRAVGIPTVICVSDYGSGFGIGLNRSFVVVTGEDGKIIFSRHR